MSIYVPPTIPRRTASNVFAFVGDSRIAQMFTDGSYAPPSATSHIQTNHFFHVANALLGQRMKIAYEAGISGDRSDQYLVNLPAALASGAEWLMIWGVVNDIAQSGTTGDTAATIWARIKNAALQTIMNGINVIIVSETGSTSLSAGTQQGMVHQYNELAREFCAVTQGAYFFDICSSVISPAGSTTTAIAFNTNYSTDGTHLNGLGHWYAGNAFASFIGPLVPANASQIYSANEVSGNGNVQQLVNPLFTTTTGGSLATGITGTMPGSYYIQTAGAPSATMSVVADSGGFGNNIVANCTFTSSSDVIKILQSTTIGNFTVPGDIIDCGAEILVAAGSSNLNGVYLSTLVYPTQSNNMTDLFPINGQALPSVAMDMTLRSVPQTLLAGTTAIIWGVFIQASAAGSATVTIKRPWLRRRYAI